MGNVHGAATRVVRPVGFMRVVAIISWHSGADFLWSRGTPIKAATREILETALLTLAIFFGVRLAVQNYRVEGFSMEPNLHTGQYILVDKVSYLIGSPQRGDVVVMRFPLDPRRDFVKRIIALPGEAVEVHNGTVFINGAALKEPYIKITASYRYERKVVPENDYFVLGDNRDNSHDSHIWDWLPREYLIGKARLSYWPTEYAGVIDHPVLEFVRASASYIFADARVAFADDLNIPGPSLVEPDDIASRSR